MNESDTSARVVVGPAGVPSAGVPRLRVSCPFVGYIGGWSAPRLPNSTDWNSTMIGRKKEREGGREGGIY